MPACSWSWKAPHLSFNQLPYQTAARKSEPQTITWWGQAVDQTYSHFIEPLGCHACHLSLEFFSPPNQYRNAAKLAMCREEETDDGARGVVCTYGSVGGWHGDRRSPFGPSSVPHPSQRRPINYSLWNLIRDKRSSKGGAGTELTARQRHRRLENGLQGRARESWIRQRLVSHWKLSEKEATFLTK